MALINNKKTYESKNLTVKGKCMIKAEDQSLIKQAQRLRDKSTKNN